MNYEKIYNQLINRSQTEGRQKDSGVYFERHHIVPKCLGGSDDKTNLVLLTAREHFVAHKLLCEIHPDETKLHYALWRMMNPQTKKHCRDYNISSREYKSTRELFISAHSNRMLGSNNPSWKGGRSHNTCKCGTLISSTSISCIKCRDITGSNNGMYGKKLTSNTIQKMSNAKSGQNNGMYGLEHVKILCEYCNKTIAKPMYIRWHGTKCKFKNTISL